MAYPEKQYHRQETAKEYTKLYTLNSTDEIVVKQEDGLMGYLSAGIFATTGSNVYTDGQTINGNLTINGDINANQFLVTTMSVTHYTASTNFGLDDGDTHKFTGSVFITGLQSLKGDLVVSGNVYISGTTEFGGDLVPKTPEGATLGTSDRPFRELFVSSGSINIASDTLGQPNTSLSNVSGNILISAGGIQLLGTGSFNAVTASFAYLSGSFRHIGSQYNEGDTITTGSLGVSGSTIMIGNNSMTGDTSLTGSVNISGSTTIIGTTNFSDSSTTITGSLLISGSTIQIGMNTLEGNTLLSGSIGIVGNSTLTGSFLVSGSTTQIGNNTLTGMTVLSGSVEISGSTIVYGTTTFRNHSTTITGSLNVTGSTTQTGNNTLIGNTQLTGSVGISGSVTLSSGSALSINDGFYVNGNKQFNYGQFCDLTIQSGSANTTYPMKLNTTDVSNGVSVVSGSFIKVANTGTYNLQFSAQLEQTSNNASEISIWLRKDGTDIPNSNTELTIEKISGGGKMVAAWNYMVQLNANQYVQLMWCSTRSDTQLHYHSTQTTPTRPETPSLIATLTQIA